MLLALKFIMAITEKLRYLTKVQAMGLLLIFAAYAPGVLKESFWSDDYPALVDTPGIVDHLLRDARPTSAGLISVSFSMLGSPQNAWLLRLLALLGISILYIVISRYLSLPKNSIIANISIAIAFCIPTFQMYVHWAIAWIYAWALLMSVLAFIFWRSEVSWKKVFGVIFLVAALTTYPPAALFYLALISVKGVFINSRSREILTELFQGLLLLLISLVFASIFIFFSMRLSHVVASNRVSLITLSDIPHKIVWLVSRPIVIGLRPFLIDSPRPIWALATTVPILFALFVGLKRQSSRIGESYLARGVVIALPLLLSLIPIAITADNQIEFRILPGYCWGILSISTFLLVSEVQSTLAKTPWREMLKKSISFVVVALISFVAVLTTNLHYWQLFGDPYQKKTIFLTKEISSCALSGNFNSVLILPPKTAFPSLPRLGVFSTVTDLASGWVPEPNVQILLKQKHLRASTTYLLIRPSKVSSKDGVCLIDLQNYRNLLK
jgi:hypothetical protein